LQTGDALSLALQEKARLQQDLRLMLAAKDSISALACSLKRAVGGAPLVAA
jgi:hypothetical protein